MGRQMDGEMEEETEGRSNPLGQQRKDIGIRDRKMVGWRDEETDG